MAKDLDTRNFAYDRTTDTGIGDLSGFAETVSYNLPGEHKVNIARMNSWTGCPDQLISTKATSSVDVKSIRKTPEVLSSALIDQAVEHVKATALALGFAAAEPPDLVPDPHVEELNSNVGFAVHLYQQYRGIPVFQMERTVRFNSDGAVIDIAGKTVPTVLRSPNCPCD
jgi:hypothetical protein